MAILQPISLQESGKGKDRTVVPILVAAGGGGSSDKRAAGGVGGGGSGGLRPPTPSDARGFVDPRMNRKEMRQKVPMQDIDAGDYFFII